VGKGKADQLCAGRDAPQTVEQTAQSHGADERPKLFGGRVRGVAVDGGGVLLLVQGQLVRVAEQPPEAGVQVERLAHGGALRHHIREGHEIAVVEARGPVQPERGLTAELERLGDQPVELGPRDPALSARERGDVEPCSGAQGLA